MTTTAEFSVFGSGNPVLLLTAEPNAAELWHHQIEPLESSFQTIVGSCVADENAVQTILETNDLDRIALIGHGQAATACSKYAADNPDRIAVLILVGSADIDADKLSAGGFPTAFIVGIDDKICPVEDVRAAQAALSGSFIVEVIEAGHDPFADKPTEFNDSVLSILQMAKFSIDKTLGHSNNPGYKAPTE